MRAPWLSVLAFALACGGKATPPPPLPPLPHAAYAHYLEGKLAAHREDWATAVAALGDAARAAPGEPVIAVELARAQAQAKQPAAARATLASARRRWPRHALVWIASGDLAAAGAPAEASAAYRRAIDIDPDDERPYLGLIRLETRPREVVALLRKLVRRVPASVEGHYRLAQRLAIAREIPAAIAELRAVLELDPDHIDARIDLARGLRLTGDLTGAIAQARSAFDRSGQALDLADELFHLLLEADDLSAALDLLTLLDDDHSDTDALLAVARWSRQLDRLAESREIAARLARSDADLGALVLAETELAAGDAAAAAQRASAIAEDSRHKAAARRLAASAWLDAREPRRALEELGDPRDDDAAVLAAFAHVDLGQLPEARACVATRAIFARARIAERAGDGRGALALLEPLIAAQPDHVPALNLAGYLLVESNARLADAARYLARARELAPGDGAVLDSWGWLLVRRGDPARGAEALRRAARITPRDPEVTYHLAVALAALRRPDEARAQLDRAALLRPSPALRPKLDALRTTLPR